MRRRPLLLNTFFFLSRCGMDWRMGTFEGWIIILFVAVGDCLHLGSFFPLPPLDLRIRFLGGLGVGWFYLSHSFGFGSFLVLEYGLILD